MQPTKSLVPGSDSEPVEGEMRPDRRPRTALPARPSTSRRQSQSGLRPSSERRASISCVSRNPLTGDDCARQRFIVWAAVRRNRSVRMAASARLECPLLRCGERFDDHESMLRHLSQCQHLSTGEYVCYECMKVERFNDEKCRCCYTQPTKRRRIINLAKHFFSNIGNTKSRRQPNTTYDDELCPPSYDSIVEDMHARYEAVQAEQAVPTEQMTQEDEHDILIGPRHQHNYDLELNGTELLELDSTPLAPTAQLDAVNYDPEPTAISNPAKPRIAMDEACPLTTTDRTSRPSRLSGHASPSPLNTVVSNPDSRRPSLALDTRVDQHRTRPRSTYLTPSSSLRSTSHHLSPITPWSATSASSDAWSAGPTLDNTLASPITPLDTDSFPPSLEVEQLSWTGKDTDTSACPNDPCPLPSGDTPELPGDNQLFFAIPRAIADPSMFSIDPKDHYSWTASVDTELSLGTSINMMFTDPNAKNNVPQGFLESQNPDGSEVKSSVESAWAFLVEHFHNSFMKLSELQGNMLADQFRREAPSQVVATGLVSLQKIISGSYGAIGALEYLCFVHVMYAFGLSTYGELLMDRSTELYDQAVSYGQFVEPALRNSYYQVVSVIWQQSSSREVMSRQAGRKGKEPVYQAGWGTDPLVALAQNYLDLLENLVLVSDRQEIISSDLYSFHYGESQPVLQGDSPLSIASNFIAQNLRANFSGSESGMRKLKTIQQRAQSGYYPTIRKLELDLIQAGKGSLPAGEFFDNYIPQVRQHCDQIFSQPGTQPRAKYHSLGITLVERLIRNAAHSQQGGVDYQIPNPAAQYDVNFLNNWYNDPFPLGSQAQPAVNVQGATGFTSTLDPTTLQPVHSTRDSPPKHLFVSSDTSDTHSDSYTVSSAPLSETQYEIRVPRPPQPPPTPTPPAHGHVGRDRSVSSNLSSSGMISSGLGSVGQKIEASDCCEICGYRPKGDPQWFKGSMAKHKKMQHSANPPVIYKCPFPGCNSEYKNRKDNLRQHQIEKNHFVGDDNSRRPQKRKKSS